MCEGCLAGKIKESFSKQTDSRIKERIRKLYCNILEIWPTSFRGYKYYLLVINNTMRCLWVWFLKTKSINDIFPALIEVIYIIEREIADRVVIIRADNSKGEFGPKFQTIYNKDGIIFEPCPVYKHSINGVSERHLYITDYKARLLLFNADLLEDF
jgi:hypothetical protein